MRLFALFMMVLGVLATPLYAAEEKAAEPAEQGEAKTPERKAMDKLAEIGIRESLKAIKKSGGLYPFGLIQSGDEVQGIGYSGDRAEAPTPEEWAQSLFWKMRKVGQERPDVDLMAVFRLHEVKDKDGKEVVGVWAEVDHRDDQPWVVFLPLLKNEQGKHTLGEMVYFATDQPLFMEPASP